jgi:hypothetical protein
VACGVSLKGLTIDEPSQIPRDVSRVLGKLIKGDWTVALLIATGTGVTCLPLVQILSSCWKGVVHETSNRGFGLHLACAIAWGKFQVMLMWRLVVD